MPPQQNNLAQQLESMQPSNIPQFELLQLSMHQLTVLMKGVKKTPAAGIDGISGLILHDIFDVIKVPLLHLINLSLCSGIYPEIFKLTKIIPVEKMGKDPLSPSSFRPVSNLSVIGKLIECAAMNQVEGHISEHHLMNKDQHGGRSKHSTMTCLGEIMEDAKMAMEDKKMVALTAVDLSAAYDLCDHPILELKCKKLLNLDQGMSNWLNSFLKNRAQQVELCGERSNILQTGTQGVVQGGPSSGLLFNIYINTMPAQVNNQQLAVNTSQSTCKQFVDDGTIISRGRNILELKRNIEADFAAVRTYLIDLKMVINPEKTQLMVLKSSQLKEPLQIELNGSIITSQDKIKVLGLTISQDLKFDDFIWKEKGSLIRRIQYRTSMVKNLKAYLTPKTLHQVGNSLINSVIQYGAALWGATSETNIQRVQKAQTRAARILTCGPNQFRQLYHRQELFTYIKWLNVNQLIQVATLNLLKNAICQNSSVGFNSMFRKSQPKSNLRNKNLRVDHRGLMDRNRLIFSANAVIMFNNLPSSLKQRNITPARFKIMVKKHILTTNHLIEH